MADDPTLIRVMLDWDADAKHSIIWAADAAGLFEKRGLKVETVHPQPDRLQRVHTGDFELAIDYPHNILLMRHELPNLVSVGALVKTNPEGILTLKRDGITAPEDLRNKVIAIGWTPLGRSQVRIFLSHHGLTTRDVELVPVGRDGEERLLAGEFDALNGVSYGIPRTERKGIETNFFHYTDSGVPDSAFLVFTGRRDWVDGHGEELRSFFQCLKEGLDLVKQWGIEEWTSYTDSIEGRIRHPDEEMEVWEAILPMIDDGGDLFHHDLGEIEKLEDILQSAGLLQTTYAIEEIFLNSHLPHEGL